MRKIFIAQYRRCHNIPPRQTVIVLKAAAQTLLGLDSPYLHSGPRGRGPDRVGARLNASGSRHHNDILAMVFMLLRVLLFLSLAFRRRTKRQPESRCHASDSHDGLHSGKFADAASGRGSPRAGQLPCQRHSRRGKRSEGRCAVGEPANGWRQRGDIFNQLRAVEFTFRDQKRFPCASRIHEKVSSNSVRSFWN